jgi:flavin reductase (DIM6/NTAB) family NADH-FMN oxidoreductase RutF
MPPRITWSRARSGSAAPRATLADGLASFDTTIYREVEAGDHTIVLLRLHAVEHADDSLPLVFHRSGFGRLQHPA